MKELTLGGLTCTIEYRQTDEDHGPAIRILGQVNGETVQLLRFDCFANDPHYHYDPMGENQMFHLDPLTMGCPVDFSLAQIAQHAKAMIQKAGFPQAAEAVNQDEIANRVDEIRQLIAAEQSTVTGS